MQATPCKKKARFSQVPQVFQYSKNRKSNEPGEDSMLLDSNSQEKNQSQKQTEELIIIDDPMRTNLEQLSTNLDSIQNFLNQDDDVFFGSNVGGNLPKEEINTVNLTPMKEKNDPQKVQTSRRFSISLRPEMRTGRDTMNYEQETKVKSTIKQIPDQLSNNKIKKISNELNSSKQKMTIEQRIQNQIKKHKRITKDTKQLMDFINEIPIDQQRVDNDRRRNRITMDVFALSKMIDTADEEENQNFDNLGMGMTPGKQSHRKNIFSAFKEEANSNQIKLFTASYLHDANKRLAQKQFENKKQSQYIQQLKAELNKLDLKITDTKKRCEKKVAEKSLIQKKVKNMLEQLGSQKYKQDLQMIRHFEYHFRIRILKLQIEQHGCYGHFIFDEIFLKIKSKRFKNEPTQIKFMVSQKARNISKNKIISIDDATKILKSYHSRISNNRNEDFMETVLLLRSAYEKINSFDSQIWYFGSNFQIANSLQFSKNFEKFGFKLYIGEKKIFAFEIDLMKFLQSDQDQRCVRVYDQTKQQQINLDIEGENKSGFLFEKAKKMITAQII